MTATTFAVATSEYLPGEAEEVEYHAVIARDTLKAAAGQHLAKGDLVAVTGSIRTRTWDDDQGTRHYTTEVRASSIDLLAPRSRASKWTPRQALPPGEAVEELASEVTAMPPAIGNPEEA